MLTYLTNCLFKTRKYKQSLAYAEILKTGINEYDGFLKDKYLFYYYNSLIINYSLLRSKEAFAFCKKFISSYVAG